MILFVILSVRIVGFVKIFVDDSGSKDQIENAVGLNFSIFGKVLYKIDLFFLCFFEIVIRFWMANPEQDAFENK